MNMRRRESVSVNACIGSRVFAGFASGCYETVGGQGVGFFVVKDVLQADSVYSGPVFLYSECTAFFIKTSVK